MVEKQILACEQVSMKKGALWRTTISHFEKDEVNTTRLIRPLRFPYKQVDRKHKKGWETRKLRYKNLTLREGTRKGKGKEMGRGSRTNSTRNFLVTYGLKVTVKRSRVKMILKTMLGILIHFSQSIHLKSKSLHNKV